jgi:POT family proton-dependent oligopeptide transporter
MAIAATASKNSDDFFGHPKGLFVLFFTEMWERMSYYGMRVLLVLYMVKYLLVDPERTANVIGFNTFKSLLEVGFGPLAIQPLSSELYGLYSGFVYLSPFFGGILADRVWGKKRSVYVGGTLMAIGHFLMAFESQFLVALFFLILGNGAFKPNISSQVGHLYKEDDPRRDGAFTIFYMGINLGAFFAPILCTNFAFKVCEWMGLTDPGAPWHMGFSFAGFGMLIGMLVYHWGRHHLAPENSQHLAPIEERTKTLVVTTLSFLGTMVAFLVLLLLPSALKVAVIAGIVGTIVYVIRQMPDPLERSKVAALVTLCLGTVAFWAIFEQQGNTLQLWADERSDWESLGLMSTNYQNMNPLMIFIFAPILTGWWERQARRGKAKMGAIKKMAVGCFMAGAAFLVLALATQVMTPEKSVSNLVWLVFTTWIFTMGELYLSPIGLSLVTKVSPPRLMSMMMGMWFLSSFIGNYLAGRLGSFYSSMSNQAFFLMFAVLGAVVGVFFLLSNERLQKIVGHDV